VLRRQLVYVAVSRASQAVTLVARWGSDREGWGTWLRDGVRVASRDEASSDEASRDYPSRRPSIPCQPR